MRGAGVSGTLRMQPTPMINVQQSGPYRSQVGRDVHSEGFMYMSGRGDAPEMQAPDHSSQQMPTASRGPGAQLPSERPVRSQRVAAQAARMRNYAADPLDFMDE
jgi:hypothetical protein